MAAEQRRQLRPRLLLLVALLLQQRRLQLLRPLALPLRQRRLRLRLLAGVPRLRQLQRPPLRA